MTASELAEADQAIKCSRLWAAVLETTLDDLRRDRNWHKLSDQTRKMRDFRVAARQRYFQARGWINSDADHVGSLRWVCDVCGLDVRAVRVAAARWM